MNKCSKCEKNIEEKDSVHIGRKYYCIPCYTEIKTTCVKCGKVHNESSNIYVGNDCYCESCYSKKKIDEAKKKREKSEWDSLYDYICEKLDIKKLSIKTIAILRKYKENYPTMTFIGMKSTLEFYYELEGREFKEEEGIGIIPFNYDRAKQFYIDRAFLIKKSKENAGKQLITDNDGDHIIIRHPIENKKEVFLINIEEIGRDEG